MYFNVLNIIIVNIVNVVLDDGYSDVSDRIRIDIIQKILFMWKDFWKDMCFKIKECEKVKEFVCVVMEMGKFEMVFVIIEKYGENVELMVDVFIGFIL